MWIYNRINNRKNKEMKIKIRIIELIDCPKLEDFIHFRVCLNCPWHEGYYDAIKYIDCNYKKEEH